MSSANVTKLKRKATEFEQKKQFEKALELYIQVIDEAGRDIDDADLQLFNRVGDLLTRQGSVSEALAYYEKAVDVYAERGFLNNAIALCNKILRQAPSRTAVYYKLGRISANKGFKSDARKNFLEYADRMQKAGNLDEAFRALKEFADLCPDQDDIRLMLADLLTKENRTNEAVEQLEQLYAKLEAEGRSAEARATMERIKTIDPDITPRTTGAFQAQKTNDLVFLDIEPNYVPPRAATPIRITPIAPPIVDRIDVKGVGALEGLSITFLPDEEPPPAIPEPMAPLPGLESIRAEAITPTHVPVLRDLDHGEAFTSAQADDVESLLDPPSALEPTPDVAPLADLDQRLAELADVPERQEPSDDSDTLGELTLSIDPPRLGDETPDAWVDAALGAPRNDATFDRLLTPFDNAVIGPPPELGELSIPPIVPLESAADLTGGSIELDGGITPLPEFDLTADTAARDNPSPPGNEAPIFGGTAFESAFEAEHGRHEAPVEPPRVAAEAWPPVSDHEGPREAPDEPNDLVFDGAHPLDALARSASDNSADAAVDAPESTSENGAGAEVEPIAGSGSAPARWSEQAEVPPEFALEEMISTAGEVAPASALDTDALRAEVAAAREEGQEAAASTTLRSAFEEERVELPLIDLEASAMLDEVPNESDGAALSSGDIDHLLSAPPQFGDTQEPTTFEPAPLDLGAPEPTDEWETPEVLIDGEWRDEHVGDLVSGEMYVIGERKDAVAPDRPAFDDLTAAMLYTGDDQRGDRGPTPTAPGAFTIGSSPPRSSVSFGGLEAQLRRRLEITPNDAALLRQLGEALLESGQREEGLNELEAAVREYEGKGDLERARETVDVILRVVPLSVRHHQKRVEYAVRSSDRVRLIEAYTELADALFRCGEPDKARVVYGRVIELSPNNERARFALGMLSNHGGTPRSSDEIPSIDTGILAGGPSITMATLTPEALEAFAATIKTPPELLAQPENPEESSIDADVEAAFSAPEVKDARRRTEELVAVEEWAATQAPKSALSGDFIDLGDWIRGGDRQKSTRMVASDVAPTGDEAADFAEMLRRFKQGVAENVDAEDFASHYDLGVAYKEMGLVDEAIAQFQKALRGPDHRVRAYEALGNCFTEKGQHQVVIALLQGAVESRAEDQQLIGVLYLLGQACEAVGRQPEAVGYYQRIFAVDIDFRDVAKRLSALSPASRDSENPAGGSTGTRAQGDSGTGRRGSRSRSR